MLINATYLEKLHSPNNIDGSHDEINEMEDATHIPFQAWMVLNGISSMVAESADKEIYMYIACKRVIFSSKYTK